MLPKSQPASVAGFLVNEVGVVWYCIALGLDPCRPEILTSIFWRRVVATSKAFTNMAPPVSVFWYRIQEDQDVDDRGHTGTAFYIFARRLESSSWHPKNQLYVAAYLANRISGGHWASSLC
jgi:hypothetical protein